MQIKKLFNYSCPMHKGSTTSIINGCTEEIINLNKLVPTITASLAG